jgi:hypothetical protein
MRAVAPRTTFIGTMYELLQRQLGDATAAEILRTLGISIRSCVLDTNSILNLISYVLRTRREIPGYELPLLTVGALGGVHLLASTTVRDEVPEKIVELCPHKIHMDPAEAVAVWRRDFAPRFTFVDPSQLPLLSICVQIVAALDEDDVPTGQLIELSGAHAVYSNDQLHLGHFGILGKFNAEVSTAYRAKSQRDAAVLTIFMGGEFVVTLSMPAVEALVQSLGRVDWRIWLGIAGVAIAGVTAAYLHPRSRQWMTSTLVGLRSFAEQAIEALVAWEAAMQRTNQILIAQQRPTDAPRTAMEYAFRALAAAPGPLTSRGITDRMIEFGYQTTSQNPHYYVAHVLRRHDRLFEELSGRRWRLRSHEDSAALPTGTLPPAPASHR